MAKAKKNKDKLVFYICVAAFPVLQFVVFYLVVNFRSFLLAFQRYDIFKGYSFSASNYPEIFKSMFGGELSSAFKNSFYAYLTGLFFGTGLSVLFSNYIYKKRFAHGVFRIVLFLPQILSVVVLSLVYKFILDQGVPIIAEKLFGKSIRPVLADKDTQFLYMLIFTTWSGFGVSVLTYTSAMSSISAEIVESAQLDGVTPIKEFAFITFPLIYPTFVTYMVVCVAGFFTNQASLFTFYGDSVPSGNQTIGYFLYAKTAVASDKMDYDSYTYLSAFGFILTLIAVPLTFIVKNLLEKVGPSVE